HLFLLSFPTRRSSDLFNHLAITPVALFWGILSAFGEATYTLIPVNIVKKVSSMVVTGWGMIFAGISLLIIDPQFHAVPNKPEVRSEEHTSELQSRFDL